MPQRIEGKIESVAEDGNLVTDIPVERLSAAPRSEQVTVRCDEHVTLGLFSPDHDQPPMTFIAVLAESGFLELAIVGDSAKIMLGIRVGESVSVEW
ncbi:MAG: adenosylmethionine-8-amino-7-oxononanoate aminotransferase [Pirellulaceae bacterium]